MASSYIEFNPEYGFTRGGMWSDKQMSISTQYAHNIGEVIGVELKRNEIDSLDKEAVDYGIVDKLIDDLSDQQPPLSLESKYFFTRGVLRGAYNLHKLQAEDNPSSARISKQFEDAITGVTIARKLGDGRSAEEIISILLKSETGVTV